MIMLKVFLLLLAIETTNSFLGRYIPGTGLGSLPDDICKGPHGDVGEPGEKGEPGYPGEPGEKGRRVFPRMEAPLTAPCYCPGGGKGEKGMQGTKGFPGIDGFRGYPGTTGPKGNQGIPGLPGEPGAPAPPLPRYPPDIPGTVFIPVLFHGKVPRTMCHHLRKQAYVPGVPHDWLGWYETGRSSYLTFDKWLYFSSRFQCPCSVPVPPFPTPSPAELLRLL